MAPSAKGTAVLPEGWKERLVPIRNENTRGANREKDRRFVRAAAAHRLVDEDFRDAGGRSR